MSPPARPPLRPRHPSASSPPHHDAPLLLQKRIRLRAVAGLASGRTRPHAARISDALICLHAGPVPRGVRARDQRRARAGAAGPAGPPRPGRRPQPHPDDEAAAGPARRPGRHQRPGRTRLHQARRRPAAHRRPGPARGPARLGPAGQHFPIFHDAERVVADPIVRLWGTIGGSLCQADPSEDLSAVFAAVRATAVIRGQDGDRERPGARVPPRPVRDRHRPGRAAGRDPGAGAGPARAARTRRWHAASATGRWPPPGPCSSWTRAPSTRRASA